jgi:hypothetical protein
LRSFQWYKNVWFGQSFPHVIFLSNIWELVLGATIHFSFLKNSLMEVIPWSNLVPFSLGEHGWGYHFVSSLRKVLFSLGHLAWKSLPKAFFFIHFFHGRKIEFEKRIKPLTLCLKGEILTIGYEFIFLWKYGVKKED